MCVRRLSLLAAALLILGPSVSSALASPDPQQSGVEVIPTVASLVTFRGRVVDSSGAPLVGARVTVVRTGEPGSAAVSAVTDVEGRFTAALAPGPHNVRVAAPGFTEASQHVNVGDGAQALHEIVLQVEGLRESVSVTAATGYEAGAITSATKTPTPLRDVPQSVTVVTQELIKDQLMTSIGDVVRYVPGITAHQGENNRDQVVIRGNSSSADFFVERRARRRAVLPRPLQPRSRRGAEGAERDDLRPRRRRRRRSTASPRRPASSRCARSRCRAARSATSGVTADLDQPLGEQRRVPRRTACTRTPAASATTSTSSATASTRRSPSRRATADEGHARLRAPARHARRRPRHHLVPGPARRRRHRRPTTAIRTTATCSAASTSRSALIEHRFGARDASATGR